MDCWSCERPALGTCRFCGRGVCREHARSHPFILSVYRQTKGDDLKALVVEDALHCGFCKPRGEPVDVPELE